MWATSGWEVSREDHRCHPEFILYKQSLGMTYKNRALKLTAFARWAGPVEIDSISPETVRRFLDAGRPVTAEWFNRFSALKMFFRFRLSRGGGRVFLLLGFRI